ncbi:hemin receptor [Bacteroidia bacterium]|nr:hemin receptor [Bacteroidia bacterium]
MKRNLLFIIALFVCACTFAQGEIDALRMSRNDLSGSARGQAMAGAFGALGGDITGVAVNPAGIGVYRSSEVLATLGFTSNNIQTNLNGTSNKQDKFKFAFDNISYIGSLPTGNDNMPVINIGFTYNNLKNFDRNYIAGGKGIASSLTDYISDITRNYVEGGNRPINGDVPWLSQMAWKTCLLDNHDKSVLHEGELVDPHLEVRERGHIDSYDFSIGSNLGNSFYWGATLSMTDIYYTMDSWYDETFQDGGGFMLDNYLQTEGYGLQLGLGLIWRPTDVLRMGVSFHSPTWYSMTDYYQGTMDADVPDDKGKRPDPYSVPEETGNFNYRFQSPYSLNYSIAGVFGGKAIVSLDYEIKDYTSMGFHDESGYAMNEQNDYIKEDFKVTSTVRAGFEYRFTSQFSARLGYAYMQNPYEKSFKNNEKEVMVVGTIPHYTLEGDKHYFTAGIGYRFTPNFYMDLAFVYKTQEDDLYFYPLIAEKVSFKNNLYKGLLTAGYRF